MTSGALDGAAFLLDNFSDLLGKAVCIRLFWRNAPGAGSPMDRIPESIQVAHRKAERAGVTLSSHPTKTYLQDVRLVPGEGIRVVLDGSGDYAMLTMEFEVLERRDG
ncbi:MAG TPA: hypothetical protein VIV60_05980 [Polyangiaceae bacterium]